MNQRDSVDDLVLQSVTGLVRQGKIFDTRRRRLFLKEFVRPSKVGRVQTQTEVIAQGEVRQAATALKSAENGNLSIVGTAVTETPPVSEWGEQLSSEVSQVPKPGPSVIQANQAFNVPSQTFKDLEQNQIQGCEGQEKKGDHVEDSPDASIQQEKGQLILPAVPPDSFQSGGCQPISSVILAREEIPQDSKDIIQNDRIQSTECQPISSSTLATEEVPLESSIISPNDGIPSANDPPILPRVPPAAIVQINEDPSYPPVDDQLVMPTFPPADVICSKFHEIGQTSRHVSSRSNYKSARNLKELKLLRYMQRQPKRSRPPKHNASDTCNSPEIITIDLTDSDLADEEENESVGVTSMDVTENEMVENVDCEESETNEAVTIDFTEDALANWSEYAWVTKKSVIENFQHADGTIYVRACREIRRCEFIFELRGKILPLDESAVDDPKFSGVSLAGTIGALHSDTIPAWIDRNTLNGLNWCPSTIPVATKEVANCRILEIVGEPNVYYFYAKRNISTNERLDCYYKV